MFEVTSSNQPPVDQQQLQQLQQNEEIKNETTMDTTDNLSMVANPDEERKNLKRIKKLKFFQQKKKRKLAAEKKPVCYRPGVPPAQILNEVHPGLLYNFDTDLSNTPKVKFICTVEISKKVKDTEEISVLKFSGEGTSKKDAKKMCCHQALLCLYGDTYKPPEGYLNLEGDTTQQQTDVPGEVTIKNVNRIAEMRKRLNKIVNNSTNKSASQILHEMSAKIHDSAKCIQENGQIPEQRFCFQIDNIPDEAIVNLNEKEPHTINAYGFGKSKKEAKNQASKQALKQFFECNLDPITN